MRPHQGREILFGRARDVRLGAVKTIEVGLDVVKAVHFAQPFKQELGLPQSPAGRRRRLGSEGRRFAHQVPINICSLVVLENCGHLLQQPHTPGQGSVGNRRRRHVLP